jgi:hypothetical protein
MGILNDFGLSAMFCPHCRLILIVKVDIILLFIVLLNPVISKLEAVVGVRESAALHALHGDVHPKQYLLCHPRILDTWRISNHSGSLHLKKKWAALLSRITLSAFGL